MTRVQRQFVRVGDRWVHLRHAGSGPALLLLHQSPQNSAMWEDMMRRLAPHCLVIAPDTPYFGHSDALPLQAPTIADLAEATRELADAIGLARFAVMGMHTGGLVAAELAIRHPARVAALVVDGYAAFSPEESPLYGERYLPPFLPAWDGSHLRWLWARVREQKYFFPWYDGRAEAAMAIDPLTTQATHAAVMDVLDGGDAYRIGYSAAFRYTDHAGLSRLQPPAWLLYQGNDPLRAHRPRLPALPAHVRCELHADAAALAVRAEAVLREVLAQQPAQAPDWGAARDAQGWQRRVHETADGGLAYWHRAQAGPLRLVLHAPGTHPLVPADLPSSGAVLAPEMPGHGASAGFAGSLGAPSIVAALTGLIEQVAAGGEVLLEAHGAAAGYVPAIAAHLGGRLAGIELQAPWLLDAGERDTLLANLPDLVPRRAGGHLDEAWQWERERHLLTPWQAPTAQARILRAAPPPAQVHANVVELLRIGPSLHELFAGALVPELHARLRGCGVPLAIDPAVTGVPGTHPIQQETCRP